MKCKKPLTDFILNKKFINSEEKLSLQSKFVLKKDLDT